MALQRAKVLDGAKNVLTIIELPGPHATEQVEAAKDTVWSTGCRSWYLDDRGIPFAWPFPFSRFRMEMAEPRLGDYERAAG